MKLRMNEVNASFWKRVIAYIIDAIIINIIIIWPFQKVIVRLSVDFQSNNIMQVYNYISSNQEAIRATLPEMAILFVIVSLLTIAYWAILEYKLRQSIGKMILNIYVKSDEKTLTLSQCIIRNISKISGILLLIDCIGIIGNRQRFLERISKTRVIEKRFTI
ncbi:MAG: RDD family protein [archaeon]